MGIGKFQPPKKWYP